MLRYLKGVETGRSTTGVIWTHASGSIWWMSQRQTSESRTKAAQEIVWLKKLIDELTDEKRNFHNIH